ncbi:ABC transporter ATP-binding protein [Planotetraspora sp. A-T 1434]|uniref:ABC transporter ATP-binding protein n=1 Tax=Planotetraspora sp. A-T 1434 TaxID=2979219 RepID=UPI0021BF6A36|nr:ABC transporter ATP-binding protein [Planotetraspora sp. A-T 1434]MCT9929458.1 ABC transporter ATP-binding protein [Planotetraspora sp. A-T 1434]
MTSAAMAGLRIESLSKEFTAGRPVLQDVDLAVAPGEFVCVVGASGSGKSTLLCLIAGLSRPTAGRVLLDGHEVAGPGPDRGMVFQTASLFPWRNVAHNVAFGLEALGVPRGRRQERVRWLLDEVGLGHLATALPGRLSGGQQQRVSIARALACSPRVLLLDEPFGALDVQTKEDMQLFIRQVWQDVGTDPLTAPLTDPEAPHAPADPAHRSTIVMVTHDVEEAVFLGQRVLVLSSDPGRISQDIAVNLPEPRSLEMKRSPEFLELKATVEDLVRAEHRAHQARTAL